MLTDALTTVFAIAKNRRKAQPLPAMLDDRSITTLCKVIGGLSTIRLRAYFEILCKCNASIIFCRWTVLR